MALRARMSQVRCISAVHPTTAVHWGRDRTKAKFTLGCTSSAWLSMALLGTRDSVLSPHRAVLTSTSQKQQYWQKMPMCLLSSWGTGKQDFGCFFIHVTPIPAQGLPALPSFWKSQSRLSYSKNSLWVRKPRWSDVFPSLWSRQAELFKQLSRWCTIWIMLSEFVPQIRRDGKPRLCSAPVFLTPSFAGTKVVTQKLPPFALKPSLMPHNNYL